MREVDIGGAAVRMQPLKRKEVREAGLEKLGVGPLVCRATTPEDLNAIIDILLGVYQVPAEMSDDWTPAEFAEFWDHFRAEQYGAGPMAEDEAKNSERSGDGPTTQTD